jgi:hypothetical protein
MFEFTSEPNGEEVWPGYLRNRELQLPIGARTLRSPRLTFPTRAYHFSTDGRFSKTAECLAHVHRLCALDFSQVDSRMASRVHRSRTCR